MYAKARVVVLYHGVADFGGCRRALAVAEGAWDAGAEVRVRCVQHLVPLEGAHLTPDWIDVIGEAEDVPEASAEDLTWADAVFFATSGRADTPDAAELTAAREQGRRVAEVALALKRLRPRLTIVA